MRETDRQSESTYTEEEELKRERERNRERDADRQRARIQRRNYNKDFLECANLLGCPAIIFLYSSSIV